MLKQDTHFFLIIFSHILYPPTHSTLPCDGFGKFFGRLFLKTIFFTTPTIQNIFINFYFSLPPVCDGFGKFFGRVFLEIIFFVDDGGIFFVRSAPEFFGKKSFFRKFFVKGWGLFQHLKRYFYIYRCRWSR